MSQPNVDATTLAESIERVPLAAIRTDRRVNTRAIDTGWVDRKLQEGFDPDGIGVPIVSHRGGGTYVWLDGQHRGELMRRAGWGERRIECRVFHELTPAQEAALFLLHNDSRRVQTIYKFLARVTARDPVAVAITRITKNAGWKISDQASANCVSAVAALEQVYRMDAGEQNPGAVLACTLHIVTEAFGYTPEAVDGRVLRGIGAVLGRYGDAVDYAVLIKKLAAHPGGAPGLIGRARGMQQYQGGTVALCLAEVTVNLYNGRRRTNTLADWR
jgi:hypothetical protein